jgi:pyruvate carboxylase
MPTKKIQDMREEVREELLEEIKEENKKKYKLWNSVYDIFDTISMLLAATSGILLSKYIPAFREGETIEFAIPEIPRLIISFALAIGVVSMTEIKGDIKGKRKNFLKRLFNSFAQGLMWHTLLGF